MEVFFQKTYKNRHPNSEEHAKGRTWTRIRPVDSFWHDQTGLRGKLYVLEHMTPNSKTQKEEHEYLQDDLPCRTIKKHKYLQDG